MQCPLANVNQVFLALVSDDDDVHRDCARARIVRMLGVALDLQIERVASLLAHRRIAGSKRYRFGL